MNSQTCMIILALCVVASYYLKSDSFNLTCVVARRDGNTYCVRDSDRVQPSVELLAEATERMEKLVAYMTTTFETDPRVVLLTRNFNPRKIVETLPNSKYTAYSEGKGDKLAFCLRKHKTEMELIDINTLTFVAIHELVHLMTSSIGHKPEFWTNFKFLLKHGARLGIYTPVDYVKEPTGYCGLTIDSNPMF